MIFFKVFSLENGGVSATRNFGIEHAQGQYITYLDSDDTLTDNTLKTVADFFDRHFDEIDLVTYKIVPYYGEQKFAPALQIQASQKTGVYDLEDPGILLYNADDDEHLRQESRRGEECSFRYLARVP